jgi:hypothetical protein
MSPQFSLNSPRSTTSECRAHDLECRLAKIADGGSHAINERLVALDTEWSAGRVSKAAMAVVILLGTILTLTLDWWWVILPTAVGLLLLQYLFTQRSWLIRIFEELGFRTKAEIEQEKFALRTLRGDFRHLPTVHDIEEMHDISRLEGEGGIVVEPEAQKVDSLAAAKEVIEATAVQTAHHNPAECHTS